MTTTNNISSIWVNNRDKRTLLDFFMFWKKRPCPHVKLPTPLHLIESCKGLVLNNVKVKSILFSTDIALIENNDADAILAVYPFAPSQNIINTLIEFSKLLSPITLIIQRKYKVSIILILKATESTKKLIQ